MTEEKEVKNDLVVSINYTLKVDNEVIASSIDDEEPLEFLQGHGNIIIGLEREILGMKIGEKKDVIVSPVDGYGEIDEEAYIEIPSNQFPENIPVEVGIELEIQDEDGNPAYARIEEIENNIVLLNLNDPLAGKELHFSVEVLQLREASEEELDHGHAHQEGHSH